MRPRQPLRAPVVVGQPQPLLLRHDRVVAAAAAVLRVVQVLLLLLFLLLLLQKLLGVQQLLVVLRGRGWQRRGREAGGGVHRTGVAWRTKAKKKKEWQPLLLTFNTMTHQVHLPEPMWPGERWGLGGMGEWALPGLLLTCCCCCWTCCCCICCCSWCCC